MTFEKVLNLKATNNYEFSKILLIDSMMLKTFTSIKTNNQSKFNKKSSTRSDSKLLTKI